MEKIYALPQTSNTFRPHAQICIADAAKIRPATQATVAVFKPTNEAAIPGQSN